MTRRRIAAALLVAALLTSGACGVPAQDDPQIVDREDVPFDLVQDTPPPTATRP
jgi:hypothetical protein